MLLPQQEAGISVASAPREDAPYILRISADSTQLTVEVEQQSTSLRWHGCFSADVVERLTRQTANFKKFALFVKMLGAAQMSSSDSVWIDLLTFDDLQVRRGDGLDGG